MPKHLINRERKTTISTRRSAPSKTLPNTQQSDKTSGFLDLILQRLSWQELDQFNQRKHKAGRPAHRLSRGQLLVGLLFHFSVGWAGTFSEHLLWLLGVKMTDSSLSQRRQALPFEVFVDLLRRMLRPIANAPEAARYRQWLLVAIDGTSFSLANTPQVKEKCRKGRNQRGQAAFAKMYCAALVEVAMHNPLAACVGRENESEWKLALGLLDCLPAQCLLLADRLYGCGAFVGPLVRKLNERAGHFLIRVKLGLKVKQRGQLLADGSRWVEIQTGEADGSIVRVREIRATIQRPGHRPVEVRLWTSLSETEGPARELVALYMSRWEQELYFRELKSELNVNDLLQSQTPDTAAQEVAAMIIGSSLVAHERAKLAPGEQLQHRISFLKTWELLEPLWLTLLLGADILTEEQKQQLCERFYGLAAQRKMAKKRNRSCPRTLRRPVQHWPRQKNQKAVHGPLTISINNSLPS